MCDTCPPADPRPGPAQPSRAAVLRDLTADAGGPMVAASVSVGGQDRRWNHNTHYYPLILATVPAGCQRVLDVGCGEGMLARQLARRVPRVVGIDQDTTSIELARRQDLDGQIEFVR